MQTQFEYVWALVFYEMQQEVIFIQLSLWNYISLLKRACMKLSDKKTTNILGIAINIQVLRTTEYIYVIFYMF